MGADSVRALRYEASGGCRPAEVLGSAKGECKGEKTMHAEDGTTITEELSSHSSYLA